MAKKIVTLYVDDSSLRLMVTDGKRIKKWADLPLEPGLIKSNMVTKGTEFTSKIEELFKDQKVKTKKISLGVSGLHCLTRPIILPQLPNEMLDEAVRREAKRALPAPPEQLYITWQSIPAPYGKTQVFLEAIPCQTADALLKALRQAGLEPSFVDIKPLLLARALEKATAAIVDVQETEFDIVIMVDGIPQPIRTIPFPNEVLSYQEKLTMIKTELDRTINFYDSNNPDKPLTSHIPIFASGDLADGSDLCQSLSDELGNPVLSLSSPFECPEGFDPSRYMVNISLAFQKLSPDKETGPSVVNLNALPAPYQPKPISLTNILALPGAIVAVALLAFLVMLTQNASADIASSRAELERTEQLLQQRQSQRQVLMGNINELQKKISEVEASRDNFATALNSVETQGNGVNRSLASTVNSLPDTIELSSISYVNDILTIDGSSPDEDEIVLYLRNLEASGKFSDITITRMTKIEDGSMDFSLILKAGD